MNDILIDDEERVATEFNNYFIEKVGKLTEKIDKSLAVDPTIQLEQKRGAQRDSNHRFQLSTISENDTKEIIQDLKSKKSCGQDGKSAEILKLGANELIPLLTRGSQ